MIDTAAPSLMALGGATPDPRAAMAAPGEENGAFAEILALKLDAPPAPQGAGEPSANLLTGGLPVAEPVDRLPVSGNSLPVALPGTLPPPLPREMTVRFAPAPESGQATPTLDETAQPETDEPQTDDAQALSLALPVVLPTLPPLPAQPADRQRGSDAPMHADVQALPPAPTAPEPLAVNQAGSKSAPAPAPVPAPAPLPAGLQSARMVLEPAEASEAAASPPARITQTELTAPSPVQQQAQALPAMPSAPPLGGEVPLSATAPVRSETPVDFAQLVDRLIAAREAAAPAEVKVSLDHSEFGKVSLSFAPEATGLNVTLASPDPDFIRAIEAAGPVSAPAATPETAMNSGGQTARQGESGFAFAGGQGRPSAQHNGADQRGAAPRTERHTPSDQSAAERRRGIFA